MQASQRTTTPNIIECDTPAGAPALPVTPHQLGPVCPPAGPGVHVGAGAVDDIVETACRTFDQAAAACGASDNTLTLSSEYNTVQYNVERVKLHNKMHCTAGRIILFIATVRRM